MRLSQLDLREMPDRIESALTYLEGSRIFATGMTGPFGFWLVSALAYLRSTVGLEVRLDLLSRDPQRVLFLYPWFRECEWLRLVPGDVRHFDFHFRPYSHVIAGAATSASETFRGAAAYRKFETSVDGTRRLLGALEPSHPLRLLLLSSGSVYGTTLLPEGSRIPENWPEAPPMGSGAAMGHAKRAAEFLAVTHGETHPEHEICVARCFSFSGAGMPLDLHYAIGNFMRSALDKEPIVVRSSGSAVRSYMHLGDMIVWLLHALTRAPSGAVFNFGSDVGITILDLANLVQKSCGSELPVHILGEGDGSPATSAPDFYVPETQVTRGLLGVREWTPLTESLQRWSEFLTATRS